MIFFTRIVQFVNKPNHVRLLSTKFFKKNESSDRIWSQFVIKNKKDGSLVKLRVQAIPQDRYEDFIDLKMKHFVKEEISYKVSGVNDNPEAVKECRDVLSTIMRKPTVHTHGYFIDDESQPKPELIGASSMILISKDDSEEEIMVKTKEMKRFYDTEYAWDQLYPYDEVFKRYGVNCFYQDAGLVIHPKYRLLGIAQYDALMRRLVCQTHGVAVTGAWCTMPGSQRAGENVNCDTLFEMSYEELGRRLGIQFKDPPPCCKYMALKVL